MESKEYEHHLAGLWQKRNEATDELARRYYSRLIHELQKEQKEGLI